MIYFTTIKIGNSGGQPNDLMAERIFFQRSKSTRSRNSLTDFRSEELILQQPRSAARSRTAIDSVTGSYGYVAHCLEAGPSIIRHQKVAALYQPHTKRERWS